MKLRRPPTPAPPRRRTCRPDGGLSTPAPRRSTAGCRPGTGRTGPRLPWRRRRAAAATSRGTGGRHSPRCHGDGPGQLRPGIRQERRVGTLLADLVLEPPELGQRHLVVRVGGEHLLVELGGQAELPLVLHRGRLVEGRATCWPGLNATEPVDVCPGSRWEENSGTATTSAATKHPMAPIRNHLFLPRRRVTGPSARRAAGARLGHGGRPRRCRAGPDDAVGPVAPPAAGTGAAARPATARARPGGPGHAGGGTGSRRRSGPRPGTRRRRRPVTG